LAIAAVETMIVRSSLLILSWELLGGRGGWWMARLEEYGIWRREKKEERGERREGLSRRLPFLLWVIDFRY
jgi:hypothetical protein